MTIEIADRLVQLRKKHGLSQEELADKLGLSRQAVSKWERAEASPDTDNLICLAKLYGISLDELLSTDEDIDTIVEEQVKKEDEKVENKDRVVINDDGVFVSDKHGDRVTITNEGFHVYDGKTGEIKKIKRTRARMMIDALEGFLMLGALIAYILLGSLAGMWYNAWVVFFIPEIVCSIGRAIIHKDPQKVNIAFIAVFTFFFVCMVLPGTSANLWHPMWVVFLAIPLYHTFIGVILKGMGKTDEDKDDDDKD